MNRTKQDNGANGISTGSLQLDAALGGHGFPEGTIVEVFGNQGSGKTTIALETVHSVQKKKGQASFIDAEHALDAGYAEDLGIDVDQVLFSQPDSGEEALHIAEELCRSGAVDLIVIDSVASLVPRSEQSGSFHDNQNYSQARMLARELRKLSSKVERSDTVLLFTNQVRTRVNASYGPDETSPGGNALKFYTDVRLRLKSIDSIRINNRNAGSRISVRVVKNRRAPPHREVKLDLLHETGICPEGDLLDACLSEGIIQNRDSKFLFNSEILGIRREDVRKKLRTDTELTQTLRNRIREQYQNKHE